jgi:hypothetical protein
MIDALVVVPLIFFLDMPWARPKLSIESFETTAL